MNLQLHCKIFITQYPEMVEHETREAIYYQSLLQCLLKEDLPMSSLCDELDFWNNIMFEHAQFIDGMLDPTEESLKNTACKTAEKFACLVEECIDAGEKQILQRSCDATNNFNDFKESAAEGLLECDIKSIIPPSC